MIVKKKVAINNTTEIHAIMAITTFPDRATMVTDMYFAKYLSIIFLVLTFVIKINN